jgi:hypothetical protein
METKIVNGIEVKIRTDEEVLDWVCDEFQKAQTAPPEMAEFRRRAAKLVFDKRFPNPDMCPACHRKREH